MARFTTPLSRNVLTAAFALTAAFPALCTAQRQQEVIPANVPAPQRLRLPARWRRRPAHRPQVGKTDAGEPGFDPLLTQYVLHLRKACVSFGRKEHLAKPLPSWPVPSRVGMAGTSIRR